MISVQGRFIAGFCLLLMPWLLVIFLRIYGPITFPDLNSDFVYFIWAYSLVSFLSYIIGFDINYTSSSCGKIKVNGYHWLTKFLCVLAGVYLILTLYDFFFIKDGSFTQISAMREAANISGPRDSLVGAVAFLLSGAPPIACAILIFSDRMKLHLKMLALVVAVSGILCTFLSGGRNAFFISFLIVLFYFIYKKQNVYSKRKAKYSLWVKTIFYVGIIFCCLYSLKVFLDRFALQSIDVEYFPYYLSSEYNVEVLYPEGMGKTLSAIYAVILYLVFYITHAFSYLDEYFVFQYSPMLLGSYGFPSITRLLDIVFGSQLFTVAQDSLILKGVYLTLPGTLYIDFGYVGALLLGGLISLVLGYYLRNLLKIGDSQKLLLSYLTVVLVMSPIYSVFDIGNGFPMLLFILLYRGSAALMGFDKILDN